MFVTLPSPLGYALVGANWLPYPRRPFPSSKLSLVLPPMSGKRQKLPTKRGRPSEDPTPNYDVSRFVNEGATDRFATICKNRSFIKEKGFHHPDDFFPQDDCGQGDGEHFANHLTQLR